MEYPEVVQVLTQLAGGQLGTAPFAVHYWGMDPHHFDNPVHRHSFFEVCYVAGGQGVYIDDEQSYALEEGVLFCSRPGVWHQIQSERGLNLWFVAFEVIRERDPEGAFAQFQHLETTADFYHAKCQDHPTVALWHTLVNLAVAGKWVHRSVLEACVSALLSSFLYAFSRPVVFNDTKVLPRTSQEVLRNVTVFVKDNLSQPLQLKTVALYFHVSGRHLTRLFRQTYGMSFTAYVQQERLRRAASLLEQGYASIQEIAQEVGYQTVHHFTRAFTRHHGMPPGRYRSRQFAGSNRDTSQHRP